MINWNGKRRWIALILLIAGFVVMLTVPPVIPIIQLPGEVYPDGWEILGLRITNTFMGSVLAWILIGLLLLYVRRKMPKSGDETPAGGFYNFFEMIFEGLYGFVRNIVGETHVRYIFSFFFTIFIIVLFSNWQALVPGVDSIGFLHEHVHVDEETGHVEYLDGFEVMSGIGGVSILNPDCPWVSPEETALMTAEARAARAEAGCVSGTDAMLAAPAQEEAAHEEEATAVPTETVAEENVDAAAEGNETAATVEDAEAEVHESEEAAAEVHEAAGEEEHADTAHHATPGDPNYPWVVTPFLRPPSTDLNMTLALALIAVVMTQVLGFRTLGIGYLTKFFNFKTLFSSPLGAIDVAVGLLELIGEFAKILSFSFRLLGNIFAGSVLLFVMSYLIPFLPWPFFLIEFGVGMLQAFVFGLLTAIFMSQATAGHGGDHHDEHEHEAAEAAH